MLRLNFFITQLTAVIMMSCAVESSLYPNADHTGYIIMFTISIFAYIGSSMYIYNEGDV